MFCSRKDSPLALNFVSHKLLRKLNFHFIAENGKIWTYCLFSSIGDIFGFLLTVGALQSSFYCWPATNHIYILPVSTLWYIICSLFNHALVLSEFLSQSKFPITSCESFWSLVIANFSSPKNAWSPPLHLPSYFPINQWNYFRNPHYRVVTKGIPLTTVVLFVEFI